MKANQMVTTFVSLQGTYENLCKIYEFYRTSWKGLDEYKT